MKGRLGGATCFPVSDGSSYLVATKEETEVSVPHLSCYRAKRGDCSLRGGATVGC